MTSGLRQVGGGDKLIRRFAVLAVALGVIFGFVLPAAPASAQYIPGQPGCVIDPDQIIADTETPGTIQCINCVPEAQANAYAIVDGEEVLIGSATVADDEDGPVTIQVIYPALPEGDYLIVVRCGIELSNVLTVIGTGGQVSGPLPVTGSDSSLLVQIALILIVIGGLLALAARKRRHAYE
jgi:LPXTG-motif cell wall-anchored protein